MKLGLIGLPGSGKSALFQCLTHDSQTAEARLSGLVFSMSTVAVPDTRLDALQACLHPRKVVPEHLEVYDFPALGGTDSPRILASARETDCLLVVLRDFDDPGYPHPAGSVDPQRDLDRLETDLLMADLEVIEKRIERLRVSVTKPTDRRDLDRRELSILEGFQSRIEEGLTLRDAAIAREDEVLLSGFCFLSRLPLVPVFNIGEEKLGADDGSLQICARLEAEILELEEEERGEFMEDLGLTALGGGRIVEAAYGAMDLVTFYSTASDELRAWTVVKGSSAPEAAGKIHTDMERGFIRAEVAPWSEVCDEGAARSGVFRLEGKKYRVRDGDVITFRFSV